MNDKVKTSTALTCAQFHAQLPELIGSGEDLSGHEHLSGCKDCQALVRDLEYIAAQARLLLPAENDPEAEPSDTVWSGIASRLKDDEVEPI